MRTLTLVLGCLMLMALSAQGQILNPGFETWAGGEPENWKTGNSIIGTLVTQTSSAHSGTSAAHGVVIALPVPPYVLQPVLQSGPDAKGTPYTNRAASFSLWYKFNPVAASNDRFGINVWLFRSIDDSIGIAVAAQAISTPATTWTQVTVPFVYVSNDTPAYLVIQFQIVGPTPPLYSPTVGSSFDIDDLSIDGSVPTGVEGIAGIPAKFALEQNYPNPFNPSTEIRYQTARAGAVRLAVYDVIGREITVLQNGVQPAGKHSVRLEANTLPSGVYFYRLEADGQVATRRMTLLR